MNGGQLLVTLIALLALGGAAVGVFALSGDDPPAPTPPAAEVAPTTTLLLGATAQSESPSPSPTAQTAVSTQLLQDRDNCEEIRGTDYRSTAEREFFLENCIEQSPPAISEATADAPSVGTDSSDDCEQNVEIVTTRSDQTYNVTGLSLDEIAGSLDANAPQIEGGTAYGLTEYSYGLDGSFCAQDNGSCGIGELTIAAEVLVTLPNLLTLDQVSSEVLDAWTFYAEQVEVHENRHVRILEEGLELIRADLLDLDHEPGCDQLNHEIDKVWTFGGSQIEQRQRAFHAADAQGRGGLVVQ